MLDVSGWELRVGSEQALLPSNSVVLPGHAVTVHTSRGTNSVGDVDLGTRGTNLASGFRPGAQVALVDPAGRPVAAFAVP